MITSGNVDKTDSGSVEAAAVAMFTVISEARPGFCNTFFAIFLIHWVLSYLISRRSYLILLLVLCYRSQLLIFSLLHDGNEQSPTKSLFSLRVF